VWSLSVSNTTRRGELSLRLSEDGGDHFLGPQTLDFVSDPYFEGRSFSPCPEVALDANGVAHLLWASTSEEGPPSHILYTRGARTTPCGF
jgi:hypothetical protein